MNDESVQLILKVYGSFSMLNEKVEKILQRFHDASL